MDLELTDNERWYVALTARWAARMRAGLGGPGTDQPPGPDVAFATGVLGLRPGDRVLDLACAWGRTTLELARCGLSVTGFDVSTDLLTIARELAAAEALPVTFVAGVVRDLPALGRFDAVTAFYDDSVIAHADEADDLAALRGVAASLRPGGRFLFGTGDHVLAMPARQVVTRDDLGEAITEEILFDAATRTGTSVRTHRAGGRTTVYRRVRRHRTPNEVGALLDQTGLRLLSAWSGYRTDLPYGARPEGMVLLAERPGAQP